MTNPEASALGRMAGGKPKTYAPEELAKRTKRILAARKTFLKQRRAKTRANRKPRKDRK